MFHHTFPQLSTAMLPQRRGKLVEKMRFHRPARKPVEKPGGFPKNPASFPQHVEPLTSKVLAGFSQFPQDPRLRLLNLF